MGSAAPDRAHVIEEHLALVEVIARRYANRGEPFDDLVQAGSIGLIKAVDRFDPERGTALASFAGPLIEGEIRHHLRAGRRHGAHASGTPVEVVDGDDAGGRSEAHVLIARGWSALSPRERRLLGLRYFGDLTQAQIGEEMKLSQAQVSRLLRGALDRLRTELGADVAAPADPAYSEPEMATQEGHPTEQRSTHSGRLLVRMPQSLHAELARAAEREGVSLNALVTGALAGAVGWRDSAAADEAPHEAPPPARPEPPTRRPRWLTVALAANFAIVALAAVLAIVLLVLAWQGG